MPTHDKPPSSALPSNFPVPAPLKHKQTDPAQNRISRFTYTEGEPTATRDSELVLLTSGVKYNSIHSAGWLGFRPSDYVGAAVRRRQPNFIRETEPQRVYIEREHERKGEI